MRKLVAVLAVLLAIAAAVWLWRKEHTAPQAEATTLILWCVGEEAVRDYQELAVLWNQEHSEQRIALETHVMRAQQLVNRLDSVFEGHTLANDILPDLVDIPCAELARYVYPNANNLYPLDKILKAGAREATAADAPAMVNGKCFGLVYAGDLAVLCCDASIYEQYVGTETFNLELLERIAQRYQTQTGHAFLGVDYYDDSVYVALCEAASLRGASAGEAAEEAAGLLHTLRQEGASAPIDGAGVCGDAFVEALGAQNPAAFITPLSEALRFAHRWEDTAKSLVLVPLSAGNGTALILPQTATAVPIRCAQPKLAREFLSFARFSEQARAFPLLYRGVEEAGALYDGASGLFFRQDPALLTSGAWYSPPNSALYIWGEKDYASAAFDGAP